MCFNSTLFSLIGMILASFDYISPQQGVILQQVIDVVATSNVLHLIFRNSLEK